MLCFLKIKIRVEVREVRLVASSDEIGSGYLHETGVAVAVKDGWSYVVFFKDHHIIKCPTNWLRDADDPPMSSWEEVTRQLFPEFAPSEVEFELK